MPNEIFTIYEIEQMLRNPQNNITVAEILDSHMVLWLQHKQVTAELKHITGKLNDLIKKYSTNERPSWP